MCHLFRFSFLPWWKCPVQSQGQLQNVWDFILPRVRSRNLSQNVEMEHSVSKTLKTSCRVTARAATQLWDNTERDHVHLAFPHKLCFLESCVLWQSASPKCYFPTQNQSKFTLHYKSCEKVFETNFYSSAHVIVPLEPKRASLLVPFFFLSFQAKTEA